ncbi:hypothetical protein GCM10028775_51630 [Catellatospora paridis]
MAIAGVRGMRTVPSPIGQMNRVVVLGMQRILREECDGVTLSPREPRPSRRLCRACHNAAHVLRGR